MDGNITKEGMTKDLEAMKAAGISQATILNIGLFNGRDFGNKRILFDTPEWYEHFEYALKEADRLGIKIGIHNCDGWTTSGGPWIKPEHAMKQFVWNKIIVKGGVKMQINLPEPYRVNNYYRDVKVLAVKSLTEGSSYVKSAPKILLNDTAEVSYLNDGCPVSIATLKEGDELTIHCSEKIEVEKVAIYPIKPFMFKDPGLLPVNLSFFTSSDGNNWRKVSDLKVHNVNETFEAPVPKTSAKFFKFRFDNFAVKTGWKQYEIGELELLKQAEQPLYSPAVSNLQSKSGSVMTINPDILNIRSNAEAYLTTDDIIDLTDKLDENGRLSWNAPEGNYTIIRFGYTLTGAKNGPATAEGEGLEVDKMDTTSLNLHYNSFAKKLVNYAGEYAGNTFKFFLFDSWECKQQNWTEQFPSAFENLNGYSLNAWIPVLCGELINNLDESEAFLHDFRSTIAYLIGNNYYKHFADLCHQDNMEMHAEVIYSGKYPPLDIMKANSYADLPMFEFWSGHNDETFIEFDPADEPLFQFPMNAAVFYDKACGAEAYTGYSHYSESPDELKIFGDRAFCSGINQMILHSYAHQPTEKKPGMTPYWFGQAFNRHNTYWPHVSGWMDYQARLQYVLQNSKQVSDLLFYVGDHLPQFGAEAKPPIPKGYAMNICNYDILSKMQVVDGKLVSENGLEFSLLVLPEQKGMHYATLELIDKFVSQGAKILGEKPEYPLSLTDVNEHAGSFTLLAERIWNSEENVFSGISLEDAIQKAGILPDFSVTNNDETKFLYIHKKNGSKDFYFVANQLNEEIDAQCNFRISNKFPEKWEQKDGRIYKIPEFKDKGETIEINYRFKPGESVLFVFDEEQRDLPDYKPEVAKEITLSDISGTIDFMPAYDIEIKSVTFSELSSLTESDINDVKYFAGQAKYIIRFAKPEELTGANQLFLNLGVVQAAGTAVLNGSELGQVWSPLQEFEVSELIQENNTLEVRVGIPYRNRFIGDMIAYGGQKTIFTSNDIDAFLQKDSPLKEVGLLGPITIRVY